MMASLNNWLPKSLLNAEQQRLRCLQQNPKGGLKAYLSAPFPDKSTQLSELDVLSLDFETTGMNAVRDQLLSIGCVNIHRGKIQLNTCYHQIVRTRGKLQKDNVAIHQITDSEKELGAELKQAVDDLLKMMAGKVLLVHFARIERGFLQEACKQIYGIVPPLIMIDTLALIKRRYDLKDVNYDPSDLRLANVRESFQLPSYFAHNALNDAIATAELLLADVNRNHKGINTRLKRML